MFKSFEVNLLSDFILLLTNKYCARLIMCARHFEKCHDRSVV